MSEPFALTEQEAEHLPAAVMTVLTNGHSGKSNSITAHDIADELRLSGGRTDSRVRLAIEILLERGACIGAWQNGFYLVSTRDEAREYLADLQGRAAAIHRRYKDFSRAAQRRFGAAVEQLELLDFRGGHSG